MPTAPTILLPMWNQAPLDAEVLSKVIPFDPAAPDLKDVKEDWQPELNETARDTSEVEAFAFPTPFAWAEMMCAVIRQNKFDHILFKHYEQLVLGLVLGHLQLEMIPLEITGIGKVLAESDPRCRYFGLLRGRAELIDGTARNQEIEGKIFGGTSPDCLFWVAPRCTKDDWANLTQAISRSDQQQAYHLLADFRGVIAADRLWEPANVLWMKALEKIIESHAPTSGFKHFHAHSRLTGPVLVNFPKARTEQTASALYFPVYEKNFAANFLRGLTGVFKPEPEAERIGVYDQHNKCFEILMPHVSPSGDPLLAGGGCVRVLHEPKRDMTSNQIHLKDENGKRGLFSLVQDLHRRIGNDLVMVKPRPYLFPDVFRIPIARLGEAGINADKVSFSKQAYQLTFDPDSPGLPLASEIGIERLSQETSGIALDYTGENGQTKTAIYLDSYDGSLVGDLRALGWVLWGYFTSAATDESSTEYITVHGGELKNFQMTAIFKNDAAVRPFEFADEIAPEIYKRVKENTNAYRRMATQQRFLRAYNEQAERFPSGVNKLCSRAAQAFVRWAWSAEWNDNSFIANGHPPNQQADATIRLGNMQVTLLRDE
jgi:hypothetical protein